MSITKKMADLQELKKKRSNKRKSAPLQIKKEVVWSEGSNNWIRSKTLLSEDDHFIYIESDEIKLPNISSHTLVNLNGLNKYTTVGRTILNMFGFLEHSEIPLYQSIKGGVVEVFAEQYLREQYGDRLDLESFTVEQFAGYNQFPDEFPFSGVLDKYMHLPEKLPIEIKAKEMRDYDKIVLGGQYQRDHIIQSNNQAVLVGADKHMIVYGFISESLNKYLNEVCDSGLWIYGKNYEAAVKDLGITYEDFLFDFKIFDTDYRLINAYREKAIDLYNEVYTKRAIPKKLFDKHELEDITKFIESQS